MHLDEPAIIELSNFINERYIYRSGSTLVKLFNEYGGFRDVYGPGFMSRKDYTKEKLTGMNGTKKLETLINHLVHSRVYINTPHLIEDVVESAKNIIKYCGYSLELGSQNEYIVVSVENGALLEESPIIDVSFEEIQSKILSYIKKAEFHIWLSVAWFTDPILFNALKEKSQNGLDIQIIINDDNINNSSNLNFESFFKTYRKTPFGIFDNNIYHNKFCVIDLKYSMSGSYNWSKKAQYNKEDYTFVTGREIAEKYARRFIELKLS